MCVCFIAAWQEVEQKLGDGDSVGPAESPGPIQYSEKTPSAAMKSKYLHPSSKYNKFRIACAISIHKYD